MLVERDEKVIEAGRETAPLVDGSSTQELLSQERFGPDGETREWLAEDHVPSPRVQRIKAKCSRGPAASPA